MKELTTRERFQRMFAHQEADRVPIIDSPWAATVERWQKEGMPRDVAWEDFFGLDKVITIKPDNSPRFPQKTLEETAEYTIYTSEWGVTMKQWKHAASTPEFLDFTIKDPDSWAKAKPRMKPERDRIPWDLLKKEYKQWRAASHWLRLDLWFGFDVTHSWAVGTERVLMAIFENPQWLSDMFNTELDVMLALCDQIWDAGYTFDSVIWPDDMGYKNGTLFSPDVYRELLKPVHKRAVDWAHGHGIPAHLHSCGNVSSFIPDLLEIGIDALNPLEVKAGMDPVALKKQYGDKLVLHGGINAVLWDKPEEIKAEIERVVPQMKKNGGYIFSSDHSIPSSVSVEDFRGIIRCAKKAGAYR
jgi:uroporphyrinogen decarboxylase